MLALLALVIVQANFGILPVVQKSLLQSLTPYTLFAVRAFGAALVYQIVYMIWSRYFRSRSPHPLAEHVIRPREFLLLSFLGVSANQFPLMALTMTSSIAAVIVVPSITLFTFFFALLLRREVFSWSKLWVLLLGGAGVLVLFADGLWDFFRGLDRNAFIGNLLCLGSAMVYAIHLVLSRDYVLKMHPLQFSNRIFNYALVWTVLFLGISFLFSSSEPFWVLSGQSFPIPAGIWSFAFIVLGPTVVNYFLNFWVLRHLSASTVSGFICLQTLIGSTAAHLFLGEVMKPTYIFAAACILLSVALLSWQSLRKTEGLRQNPAKP